MRTLPIQPVRDALGAYRNAVSGMADSQDLDDYLCVARVAEKLIDAASAGDLATAKECVLGFTRQASDSYAVQPSEFRALSDAVHHLGDQLMP